MVFVLGFFIAAAIGLTGVGAGVVTTPILILFLHIPPVRAIGTALIFASLVKLLIVPLYVRRGQVHFPTLAKLLVGGLPGVAMGTFLLSRANTEQGRQVLMAVLSLTIVAVAVLNLIKTGRRDAAPKKDRSAWLPFIALPIGAEVGFSSAGAGALGSLALLSLTPLTPAAVVGTDLFFGLGIALVGGGLQFTGGNFDSALLWQLIGGGVFGAFAGATLSNTIPKRPLRAILSLWLVVIGAQMFWQNLHRTKPAPAPVVGQATLH